MAIEVLPATGANAARPEDLDSTAIAVLEYTLDAHEGLDRFDWRIRCFVIGADTLRHAREAAATWIGVRRTALMCTKVGGQASRLEVVEEEPPPPPTRVARDYDPVIDNPDPVFGVDVGADSPVIVP